jgi:glycosyltransferase involved in cell wall biosynthesis
LLFRLRDDGWNFAEIAFFGLQGNPTKIDDILVYPAMGDPFGADALFYHSADFGANVAFTMQDIWTLDPNFLSKINTWIPYVPIDKDPIPPLVLDRLRYAYKIISFSEFGQKALERAGFTSTLIPEGIDINIFKPMDKIECRKEFGLPPDAFIFGSIAANKENPPRKGFQEMLEAFKMFSNNHGEAVIFFHTQQVSPSNFPIVDYARYLGIADKVLFQNQYKATYRSDSNQIAKEINTFDIDLHASQTEGFGLGVIESQACGIPPIVNNCQSMPELVIEGKTAEICKTAQPRWTSDNGYVYPADVKSLYEKMELLYKKLHNPNTIAKEARDHVVKNYNIDTIFKEKWVPFIEQLQDEILTLPDEKSNIKSAK